MCFRFISYISVKGFPPLDIIMPNVFIVKNKRLRRKFHLKSEFNSDAVYCALCLPYTGVGAGLHDGRGTQGVGQGLHPSAAGASGGVKEVHSTATPHLSPNQLGGE